MVSVSVPHSPIYKLQSIYSTEIQKTKGFLSLLKSTLFPFGIRKRPLPHTHQHFHPRHKYLYYFL